MGNNAIFEKLLPLFFPVPFICTLPILSLAPPTFFLLRLLSCRLPHPLPLSLPLSSLYTLSAPRLIKPFSSRGQTFKPRLGNLLLKQQPLHPYTHTHTPTHQPTHTNSTSYPNITLFMAWSSTSTYIITGFYIHHYTAFHHHHDDDLRSDCFHMGRSNTEQAYLQMHGPIYLHTLDFSLLLGREGDSPVLSKAFVVKKFRGARLVSLGKLR